MFEDLLKDVTKPKMLEDLKQVTNIYSELIEATTSIQDDLNELESFIEIAINVNDPFIVNSIIHAQTEEEEESIYNFLNKNVGLNIGREATKLEIAKMIVTFSPQVMEGGKTTFLGIDLEDALKD